MSKGSILVVRCPRAIFADIVVMVLRQSALPHLKPRERVTDPSLVDTAEGQMRYPYFYATHTLQDIGRERGRIDLDSVVMQGPLRDT